jgi:hypothetical protein
MGFVGSTYGYKEEASDEKGFEEISYWDVVTMQILDGLGHVITSEGT